MGETPLAGRVEEAIDRGVEYLLANHEFHELGSLMQGYPLGSRSLIAYALVESGVPTTDKRIERLYHFMSTREKRTVYGVSLYVLALHAWKAHAHPQSSPHGSGMNSSDDGVLPGGASLRAELVASIEWLVEARLVGRGEWGYGVAGRARDAWSDYSNTQFAVLALQVGLREGVPIPRAVFEEIVGSFAKNVAAGREELEITVDRAPWHPQEESEPEAERSSGRTGVGPRSGGRGLFGAEGVRLEQRPMSWAYTPVAPSGPRRRAQARWGTTSMTAAAVSSLLVARNGLERTGSRSRKLRIAVETLVDGGVIELSRVWHPSPEPRGGSLHRNHWYTLYSFEKAMNLAGIGVLDGVDWYREQVPYLLRDQRSDGSFGMSREVGNGYRVMATSFALLFLRRATAQLTVYPAPRIITHGGNEGGDSTSIAEGRVFVPELDGSLDLDELVERLRTDRTGRVVASAQAVVAAVPVDRRVRLLPWWFRLLEEGVPASSRLFAERAIAEETGLPAESSLARLAEWWGTWQRVNAIGSADADPATLSELSSLVADRAQGLPLRVASLTALRRTQSPEAISVFLACLADEEETLRALADRALRAATRLPYPFDPGGDATTREAQVAVWMGWWAREGESWRVERHFARLRSDLERAEGVEARARARAAIVALGARALPRVDAIIAEGSYAFDWLLVREALTGERGVR